jgi:hypothetical protein
MVWLVCKFNGTDMNNNPYAPPMAELECDAATGTKFYVVSPRKFTILFFATVGLYTYYWFYANWREFRRATGERIWPIPRAIFSIFFAHSLYHKIQARLDEREEKFTWSPGGLATAYVVLSIVSNIFDRMSMKDIFTPYSDILGLFLLPALYYTLMMPQKAVNLAERDAAGTVNDRMTGANYFWIVLGVILWLFAGLGLLVTFGIFQAPQ